MPKISIIVPVYNSEKFLKKCLDSIINQTLKDIEIIIVNDGSTDTSPSIINTYQDKYPDIIKSYNKTNGGLGDARNEGIKYATGTYIGFVDSDDYIDINMYESLYKKAKEEDSDIVECNTRWLYDKKTVNDIARYDSNHLFFKIRVMVCNKIFKRELIEKHKILFPLGVRYEDIVFTYKILPYVKKYSRVDDLLYFYVQRKTSLSNHQTASVRDIFKVFNEVRNYYERKNIYDEYKDKLEYIHIRYLLGSSFLRIVKVSNRKLRKQILKENWLYLNSNYPNWKDNNYLKLSRDKKDIYYRTINKCTYYLSSIIFRTIKR